MVKALATMDDPLLSSTAWIAVLATLIWISLCIVAHLWIARRGDSVVYRLVWSLVVLLFPIMGWLFYAAFYRPPKPQNLGHTHSIIG
jgi:uncharacterized RDD family membrane protein YckC